VDRTAVRESKTAPLNLPSDLPGGSAGPVSALDRFLVRQIVAFTGGVPVTLVLWNGQEIASGGARSVARLTIRDRGALWALCLNPDLNFGDLYSVGRIDVEGDLTRFLEIVYVSITDAPATGVLKYLRQFLNRPRRNTLARSREHIHHHYDLGNSFYELWLDKEAMQYTCAYYPDPAMTLEQAQRAKMDHVCRKLQLKPGDRVVEAGCGWGGLARHMAKHYGVTVRSYNISHQQIVYAREKAKEQGLEGRVEYVEDDYRNLSGTYDVFVSIGMLEHVGRDHYRVLGDVADRCLTDKGRGLIHTIGRNKPELMNAWIEKRIFPGAYPPTLREMMEIFEPSRFSVLDVENIRLHYARTLEHWLERFESHAAEVEKTYDRAFTRAWRLYLSGSIASFTTGSLQLFQVVFARERNNDIPRTREHVYR
jgi:cyclopropane-fatty-acyl-phospholipid synthase